MIVDRAGIKYAFEDIDLLDGDYRILATGNGMVDLATMKKIGVSSIAQEIEEYCKDSINEICYIVLSYENEIYVLKIANGNNQWDFELEKSLKKDYFPYIKGIYNQKETYLSVKELFNILNYPIDYVDENSDTINREEITTYLDSLESN